MTSRRGSLVMHSLALLPLAFLVLDFFLGRLTADPIREIQLRTGRYAITLLAISLAGTPVYSVLGGGWLLRLRRLAGLYAFAYAGLHLLNLVWLDYGFNWVFLQADILEKRFIIAGLAAFVCLVPVALVSIGGWQRYLGRGWRRLRRLVYAAGLLAAVHFFWQAKIDHRWPLVFAILIIVLLVVRLPFISKRMNRVRDIWWKV